MTINECYEAIGNFIFQSVKDSWVKAVLHITKLDISVSVEGEYWDEDGVEKNMRVDLDMKTFRAITELHDIMTSDTDNDKWNRANFNVNFSGELSMDFIWDQELHDEIERLNKE